MVRLSCFVVCFAVGCGRCVVLSVRLASLLVLLSVVPSLAVYRLVHGSKNETICTCSRHCNSLVTIASCSLVCDVSPVADVFAPSLSCRGGSSGLVCLFSSVSFCCFAVFSRRPLSALSPLPLVVPPSSLSLSLFLSLCLCCLLCPLRHSCDRAHRTEKQGCGITSL